MTIDETIAFIDDITWQDCGRYEYGTVPKVREQVKVWLEKLEIIENIMLKYNADWYADEENGVPDCEVLESIWNVIQDNGLDIDIEQDYRKGRADEREKIEQMLSELPTINGYIDSAWLWNMFEKLKGEKNE